MMIDIEKIDVGLIRPIVVDSMNGRDLEISQFLTNIFAAKGSMALPNILSPEYESTIMELPY